MLAAAQWAARTQAMDQVEIARLSVTDTRRQIAVATASAYLAVIAQKRQVDVSLTAIETARGQLDYNTRRREGGVGSRLNELRSCAGAVVDRSAARSVAASTCSARRKRSACCSRPTDRSMPAASRRSRFRRRRRRAEWLPNRPDVRVFTAERDANERIVNDSRKDWWPAASVIVRTAAADAVRHLPAVAHLGVVGAAVAADLRRRPAQRRCAASARRSSRRRRCRWSRLQIEARSEVRIARAAVESRERALAAARQARRRPPTKC